MSPVPASVTLSSDVVTVEKVDDVFTVQHGGEHTHETHTHTPEGPIWVGIMSGQMSLISRGALATPSRRDKTRGGAEAR